MTGRERQSALGVIEVVGLVASIAAADSMVKAADVQIVDRRPVGGGRIAVSIRGDLSSVAAAIDAGANMVKQIGGTATVTVLGRPDVDVVAFFVDDVRDRADAGRAGSATSVEKAPPAAAQAPSKTRRRSGSTVKSKPATKSEPAATSRTRNTKS